MSTVSHALRDSSTMLRRKLRHVMRYPSMVLATVILPVAIMLLFVLTFGGALEKSLAGAVTGVDYIDYITPGIALLAIAAGSMATSLGVAVDMTKGVINRFRTMSISQASVLTGHVIGAVIQSIVSVSLVLAVALLVGFRPNATATEWFAALGLMALVSFSLNWLAVGLGLAADTVETASNTPMLLQLFLFLSSAFVPTESMSPTLRWVAENQPFTPITDTIRGLFLGTPIGNNGIAALAWCAIIALAGYLWAKYLYRRPPRQI